MTSDVHPVHYRRADESLTFVKMPLAANCIMYCDTTRHDGQDLAGAWLCLLLRDTGEPAEDGWPKEVHTCWIACDECMEVLMATHQET